MALFDRDRHAPLNARPWNAGEARRVIERIVTDTAARGGPQADWPFHKLDQGVDRAIPKTLYFGVAGVLWALDYLQSVDLADVSEGWSAALSGLEADQGSDMPGWKASPHSYLFGDSSILLMKWKQWRSAQIADALAEAIAANVDDETLDLMWSAPGTMLAALFMHEWTAEPRWGELLTESADFLWDALKQSDFAPCRLWQQNLYGHKAQLLGAVHGFAGNVFPIIKGFSHLEESQQRAWREEIVRTLTVTAIREDGLCNWAPGVGTPRPGRTANLVQHCHGAPGMIVCVADLPGDCGTEFENILLEGGELVWQAGPLAKGSNLCHGTAGNGYAFLKLFERMGDERWLDRARAFAMHSIDQFTAAAEEHGQLRYSLWTGDLGLAVYLADCIKGAGQFPTMDVF